MKYGIISRLEMNRYFLSEVTSERQENAMLRHLITRDGIFLKTAARKQTESAEFTTPDQHTQLIKIHPFV